MPQFYGTYNVAFVTVSNTCNITFATSGTITLSGNADGSKVTILVFERAERVYTDGTMTPDGKFSGKGSGFTPGLSDRHEHDYTGTIEGQVVGLSMTGRETLVFGAGCPGAMAVLDFSGTKR